MTAALRDELKNLTTGEKLALVQELWEEIEKESTNQLSDKQLEWIHQRVDSFRKHPVDGKNWETIKQKYL